MNKLEDILIQATQAAVKAEFGQEVPSKMVQIQHTRKEFEGDLTLVVFPFVRLAKKSPEQTAQIIGKWLVLNVEEIVGFNVVKGFLNLMIDHSYWLDFLTEGLAQENFGIATPNSRSQVMVEFSSPNTNKPLHLGHLRNIFLGYSVANILDAVGHDVVKVQIINDRGIHICKSMLAWQKFGEGETPEISGIKGDKLVGKYYVLFDKHYKAQIKQLVAAGHSEEEAAKTAPILKEAQEMLLQWEARDPKVMELWKMMNGWVYAGFNKTYETMGVSFDKLYYESETYLKGKEEVEKGLESGIFFQKEDGSIWVDLTEDGLDQKLLLRADGTAVYMTQDIGTAILRFQDYPNLTKQIYTVGNEQEYHFKVLFLILDKLGYPGSKDNYHLSYGMVELPEGKMKSREGTVVDADDLMEEMQLAAKEISQSQEKLVDFSEDEKETIYSMIGLGALKYFLLKVDPKKNMLFDPEESIDFLGNTGPFIQYNYVRTQAILRKADPIGKIRIPQNEVLSNEERSLAHRLYDFPAALEESAANYNPAHLANYCYDLVRDFGQFYQHSPVLKEEDEQLRSLRLAMVKLTGEVLQRGMNLLGISMPQRM